MAIQALDKSHIVRHIDDQLLSMTQGDSNSPYDKVRQRRLLQRNYIQRSIQPLLHIHGTVVPRQILQHVQEETERIVGEELPQLANALRQFSEQNWNMSNTLSDTMMQMMSMGMGGGEGEGGRLETLANEKKGIADLEEEICCRVASLANSMSDTFITRAKKTCAKNKNNDGGDEKEEDVFESAMDDDSKVFIAMDELCMKILGEDVSNEVENTRKDVEKENNKNASETIELARSASHTTASTVDETRTDELVTTSVGRKEEELERRKNGKNEHSESNGNTNDEHENINGKKLKKIVTQQKSECTSTFSDPTLLNKDEDLGRHKNTSSTKFDKDKEGETNVSTIKLASTTATTASLTMDSQLNNHDDIGTGMSQGPDTQLSDPGELSGDSDSEGEEDKEHDDKEQVENTTTLEEAASRTMTDSMDLAAAALGMLSSSSDNSKKK